MDTMDEIPLEDHRFFWARLEHLEHHHPAGLLSFMEQRRLTQHLRDVTRQAIWTLWELVVSRNMSLDQAEEIIMNQIVADPSEHSRLHDATSRKKMRYLLKRYKTAVPNFTKTYLSQNEITE